VDVCCCTNTLERDVRWRRAVLCLLVLLGFFFYPCLNVTLTWGGGLVVWVRKGRLESSLYFFGCFILVLIPLVVFSRGEGVMVLL
jgi:hypothetical protein